MQYIYLCAHTHTCTHICMHTHTHTHLNAGKGVIAGVKVRVRSSLRRRRTHTIFVVFNHLHGFMNFLCKKKRVNNAGLQHYVRISGESMGATIRIVPSGNSVSRLPLYWNHHNNWEKENKTSKEIPQQLPCFWHVWFHFCWKITTQSKRVERIGCGTHV